MEAGHGLARASSERARVGQLLRNRGWGSQGTRRRTARGGRRHEEEDGGRTTRHAQDHGAVPEMRRSLAEGQGADDWVDRQTWQRGGCEEARPVRV